MGQKVINMTKPSKVGPGRTHLGPNKLFSPGALMKFNIVFHFYKLALEKTGLISPFQGKLFKEPREFHVEPFEGWNSHTHFHLSQPRQAAGFSRHTHHRERKGTSHSCSLLLCVFQLMFFRFLLRSMSQNGNIILHSLNLIKGLMSGIVLLCYNVS